VQCLINNLKDAKAEISLSKELSLLSPKVGQNNNGGFGGGGDAK